jgi:CHASE1-domain containing sensor protein
MNDRWLPVFAAILGVLGGVAGAAVGGYIANKGQEQRFEAERASQMLDQRTDAYVRFLRAAENEVDEASAYPDPIVQSAAAEVELVARTAALRRAAARLLDRTLYFDEIGEYRQARAEFVELAHADIEGQG